MARGADSTPRAHRASSLLEDSNQFRSVRDEVLATSTPYGLNLILLNVNGHRFSAAFCRSQNVVGMVRNTSAPLAGWEVRGSYDSLADCRQEAITLFSPPATVHKGRFYVMKNEFLYSYGVRLGYVCVSSADFRLKEK